MTQNKVWGCDKKVAKRVLRDAAETGFALSSDETESLRLAVNGDPKCYKLGFNQVMLDVWKRNPRADLYMARAQAKQLLDHRDAQSFISAADMTLLRRAGRTTDVTSQQIDGIRARYYATKGSLGPLTNDHSRPKQVRIAMHRGDQHRPFRSREAGEAAHE